MSCGASGPRMDHHASTSECLAFALRREKTGHIFAEIIISVSLIWISASELSWAIFISLLLVKPPYRVMQLLVVALNSNGGNSHMI